MKKGLLLVLGLFAGTSASLACRCVGYIDGFYTQVTYDADQDKCDDPNSIDYTSGLAVVEYTDGKYWFIDADPNVCLL